MKKKMKLLVLANCTHHSIGEALKASSLFDFVRTEAVFSLTDTQRQSLAGEIDSFDYVVSLEHAGWAGELESSRLRSRLGGRLITLPAPFFSGLFPDKAYLTYGGSISRCSAALGDYHSALILEEVKSGYGLEDIVQRYASGESFSRIDIIGVWNDSLEELKEREKHNDVCLSDYIEKCVEEGTISDQFLSFNHPREGLINHIARSIIKMLTGKLVETQLLTREMHNLYAGPRWPLHPAVALRLGLPRPIDVRFKRPLAAGGGWMELDEFVRVSVDFFKRGVVPENFKIVTPHYLRKNIG